MVVKEVIGFPEGHPDVLRGQSFGHSLEFF